MAGSSKMAVVSALGGNAVVAAAKFTAFAFTGSGAMLSEAIHSVADVLNQTLLLVGMVRSEKSADDIHHYGYQREQYVWALISAVGIFFLGCGVTMYHGIHSLFHPTEVGELGWAFGVLTFSFAIEFVVLGLAFKAIREQAAGRPFFAYLKHEADPGAAAVLVEDAVACLGIIIAFVCILLTKFTGQLYWDAIGSIGVGILLGIIAIWLIVRNHRTLVGPAAPAEMSAKVKSILEADDSVEYVAAVKSRMIDGGTYDFALEVEFDGDAIARKLEPKVIAAWDTIDTLDDFKTFSREYADDVVEELGDQVNELERKIREQVPQAVHLDIETN